MLLAAIFAITSCTQAVDPGALVDAYKVAMSAPRQQRGTTIARYAFRGVGLSGDVVTTSDLETGRYVREQRAGPVVDGEGFDGRTAWRRDFSNFVTPQSGGDRRALAINEAYRIANLWWHRDRGGAILESAGCGSVRATPRNGKPFQAWFDPATNLLARVREVRSFGTVVETEFTDYTRHAGRLTPSSIQITYGGEPQSRETLRLETVQVLRTRAAATYNIPEGNPNDWTLPHPGHAVMPFRLINNHVIVDVRVNGDGPFPFLVDTGGHNILTPSTIAALGLAPEGSTSSSGAGEKSVSSGYARVRELNAGGAIVRDQTLLTLDFSPRDVEGLELGGMLGAEFLERFVVTFDYGAGTLTLTDPARFKPPFQAAAVPMNYYLHMPQVAGSVDGRPARLNIDTGARDELTLTSPFVAANALRRAYPDGVEMTTGWGVGGPSRTYTVRARAVALGPVAVTRPVVGLSSAKRGAFSDTSYDGNVGSGLLKRFVTTFDYGRRTMYLVPVLQPDPDVGRLDRVGMWLNLRDNGMEVMDVVPSGPAAQAGLRTGDLATVIGGIPFDRRSLSETRRALRLLPQNDPIEVRYQRDRVGRVTQVLPRDLIPD